jgi:DNA polymerase alpha subunit B
MDELSSGFTDFGLSLDMQLLQRINDIRCQHGFSVEDIIDEWIAFSENHQVKEVTDSTVEMFENKICGKLQKSNDITVHHGQVKHTGFQSDQFVDLVDEEIFSAYSSLRHDSTEAKLDPSTLTSTKFVTPHGMENSNPSHLEPKVSSNVRDFNPDLLSSRQEKHGPNETIASIGDIWIMEDIHPRVTVEIRMSEAWMQTWDDVSEYGYQYHGSYAKASSINKHIHTIGDLLLSNNSQFDEPVSLAIPTQESCVYTGIVVSESTDSKLNPSTCLFMGSREVSQGHVVKLDLSAVNNYSIFPGQVIAVEGTCTGKKLIADALFTDCPLKQLDRSNSVVKGFKMMISAGPFTTSNNLDYACLYELLTAVKSETPEVLILVGPFLDVRHPLLQTAKEKENFPAVILNRILAAIHTVCHKCQTEVVTIPSQFDLLHHQVYPQSPFVSDRLLSIIEY